MLDESVQIYSEPMFVVCKCTPGFFGVFSSPSKFQCSAFVNFEVRSPLRVMSEFSPLCGVVLPNAVCLGDCRKFRCC